MLLDDLEHNHVFIRGAQTKSKYIFVSFSCLVKFLHNFTGLGA